MTSYAISTTNRGAAWSTQQRWPKPIKTKKHDTRTVMRKFHLPHGRDVATKAAGFLFRVRDDDQFDKSRIIDDFDGLIVSDKYRWYTDLEFIRTLEIDGKAVSILGMDSPDDFMPPTWVEIMQLRDAFFSSGAKSVDYIHYEDDSFKIDM